MKIIDGYVANISGLSSRLSAELVSEANKFKSNMTIVVLDERADLKSIMNVMALVVPHGESFTIEIEGSDEVAASEKFAGFLKELRLTK